jgi:hypothetical protein
MIASTRALSTGGTWLRNFSPWGIHKAADPQPLSNVIPSEATGKFAEARFLFCENLSANVASRLRLGRLAPLINQLDEHLWRSQGVLNRGQSPRVRVAQAMDVLLWMIMERGRLKLQETAERASGFLQHLQNRLVDDKLSVCPHQMISAIIEPNHTAARPRIRLLTE